MHSNGRCAPLQSRCFGLKASSWLDTGLCLFWQCGFRSGDAMAMAICRALKLNSMVAAMMMQQHLARRSAPYTTLFARLPALLLLRSSFLKATPEVLEQSHISSQNEKPVKVAATTVGLASSADSAKGETVPEQAVTGLPTRLDCRLQLQYEHQCRNFSLVFGAGSQDVCAITFLKSPWPIYPSLSVLPSSHGRRSNGQIRCSSYSAVWKRSTPSANASVESGDTQTIEQVWEEYFADTSQWWDNRVDKKNPRSPDLKHKVTRKALWIDGWSTPAWVKARLNSVTQGRLQCHAGYGMRDSQDVAHGRRLPTANNGKESTVPNSARELRKIVPGGGGSMHVQNASNTIEAIAILKNRLQHGFPIDSYMYNDVLKRCLKQKDLIAAKQVHDCIIKSGMDQNTYVANNLVNVYIRCGKLQDARRVFDGLVKKSVISWNVIIGGYAQHNHAKDAMEVFTQMLQEGAQPDEITYLSIMKACASPSALKWSKEVHAHIRHAGLESDMRVGTALLKMYANCGSIKEARQAFDNLTHHDVMSWTVMIGAYAERGCGAEAYRLFLQMKREGFRPDAITYVSILNACASAGALEWVKEVHSHALDAGFESDLRVASALIHMYANSGSMDDARQLFDRMEERNVVTWNIMIGGLAQHGHGRGAYELFLRMQREGCVPNAITYVSILNACASAGALEWVKEVHCHALEAGFASDVRVGTALVHMYANSGSIDDARLFFDRMEERNVFTWNVMIGAYAESGCGEEAYRLFLQMKREGFKPDAITYVSILNACASAGALEWMKEVHNHALEAGFESDLRVGNALVHMYAKGGSIDKARLVFGRMEERDVFTWNILIGGLAQQGCGHEALEVFRKMNADGVRPDGFSFVAVLSACSHAGLVDEGRRLFLAMSQEYGIEPTVVHCTCMVDLLGRAGHLEEAKLFIGNMPVEPNEATWGALLGACRTYGNVELGELVAAELFKLNPQDASTYVLLSNIYAAAGKWEEVSLVRSMMQERGVRKEPGRSWIEVDNKIHRFVVGDTSHPEAKEIYAVLKQLTERLKAEGYIPDTQLVLQNIDEEDKELALCSHSEKLAIAYGLMHTPRENPIRVYKNLRVCSDCHTATKFISKVTGREIVARDANRFHHFKDGICSCGDYW